MLGMDSAVGEREQACHAARDVGSSSSWCESNVSATAAEWRSSAPPRVTATSSRCAVDGQRDVERLR